MSGDLTIEAFRPHVGSTFHVRFPDGQSLPLTLEEVSGAPGDHDARRTRAPFSLIFRPPAGVMLGQANYCLEGALGSLEIFLVPILPDARGGRLQAVFG
ncbi:MAG TPA: hypothetical protein VN706_02345 [Gemmatimonadaceae bacterium]|nr:hypothetical protein [Gemmatimonadaceae bacterium]